MIGTLETWRWAVSDEGAELRAAITPDSLVGVLARLRQRWSPEQVAVTTELVAARAKAKAKFGPRADTLACDREGVEMASSARSAAYKAARLTEAVGAGARVLDACCGVGGDAMAMTDAGLDVTALDLDERRAWMGGHNAGCRWLGADVRTNADAFDAVHADPARRSGGRRTHTADDFEPPLSEILPVLLRARAGAVKLNPGIDAGSLPTGELEIISESGALTQGVLWTGAAAVSARRATLLAADGSTHTLAGEPDRPYDASPLGAWAHTFDPSVERADLVRLLLDATGLALLHPGTGLLTGDAPSDSPWVTPFRVLDDMAWSSRAVRARLRELDAGAVTVKARAGVVDPDRVSRELRGAGARELTVFVLPVGGPVRAIIAERAPKNHASPEVRSLAGDVVDRGAG